MASTPRPDDPGAFDADRPWSTLDRRQSLMLAAGTGVAATASTLLPSAVRGDAAVKGIVDRTTTPTSQGIPELAASLDNDVERIFRFVSEEIRYEPYVGVLRGASGTLLGRSGNSADQALLLAELLTASGVPVRFAWGAIDDATATAILDAAASDVATAQDDAFRVLIGDAQAAGPVGGPLASHDPEQEQSLERAIAEAPAVIAGAASQLADSVGTIMAALAQAGITLPDAAAALPERERSQHVWVQAGSGADQVDLDPTLPIALAGETLTSADSTMDTLPDDLRHQVEFAAVAESWLAGQLVQTRVLEYATFADLLVGVPVAFTNAKSDDMGLNILGNVGGGSAQYTTVLEVGPKVLIGETPLLLGDQSGDLFGGGTEVGGLLEGEASAEWLEVRVASPDAEPVIARRTIFDRIGDPMRSSGTIDPFAIAPIKLVESGAAFGEYPPLMTVHAFAVVGGPVSGQTMLQPLPKRRLGAYSWLALAYHTARDGLASEIGLEQGVRVVVDRPGVVALAVDVSGGAEVEVASSLDIWHRGFATLPVSDRAATAHPAVVAGVLSHVAERIATDGIGEDGLFAGPVSAGLIFDLAREDGVPIRVLQGSLPDASSWPTEAVPLLVAALEAGKVVIVPEQPVQIAGRPRLGWWLVDPVSGHTEDQLDTGRGAATSEYVPTSIPGWLRAIACLVFVGEFVFAGTAIYANLIGRPDATMVSAIGVVVSKIFNKGTGRLEKIYEKACIVGKV